MAVVELPPGIPQPSYLWIPDHVDTAGPEVAQFAAGLGYTLDDLQRFVLDLMYAERADGELASMEFGLCACRQNLKSYTLEPSAVYDAWVMGTWVAWTSHRMRTTGKVFNRVLDLVDSFDWLRREVKRISTASDAPFIELFNGGGIQFLPRTPDGARGLSSRKIILDEALMLTAPMMESIVGTMMAMPNPSIVSAGSAGGPTSHVWRDIRDRGRRGGDQELIWVEFGDKEPPSCQEPGCRHSLGAHGCSLDDVDRMARANPAIAYGRVTIRKLQTARRALATNPLGFAREHLGWWGDPAGLPPISAELWQTKCLDTDSRASTTPRFAVDVGPGAEWAAIGAAAYRPDNKVHVEITSRADKASGERILDHRLGVDWILPRLRQLQSAWSDFRIAIAAGSPAEALKPDIESAGIPVDVLPLHSVNAACGALLNRAKHDGLRHIGQPGLDTAALAAYKLTRGDAGAFRWVRRNDDDDLTPLYAVTLALFALAGGEVAEVSVFGGDLDLCDVCGQRPHDDPDGEHNYRCPECREEEI